MPVLNAIQQKLIELGQGEFQKLIDEFLQARRIGRVVPIGSVAGKSKTRPGTPDTRVDHDDGTFSLVECSTQATGIRKKFLDDLDKCFDESKIHVSTSLVSRVLLCTNFDLQPKDESAFRAKTGSHGVRLDLWGLQTLSLELKHRYPGLVKQYLGVSVDRGQILAPDEFVDTHDRNRLATPLGTQFLLRTSELENGLKCLESDPILLVTGAPGVGKSRLALEICREFARLHPDFETLCLFQKNADLFEDIRECFSGPGKFIVLIDDANRHSGFDYLVQRLVERRDDQEFRLIATVREYALKKVRDIAFRSIGTSELSIAPFDVGQMQQFIQKTFDLHHHIVVTRITDLAQGNPRLAAMIARRFHDAGNLDGITDVAALYDQYYGAIRKELVEFSDLTTLKTAGIVSFFRILDFDFRDQIGQVLAFLNITLESFHQSIHRLHDVEVLDLYEGSVVKSSDQILSTYLCYVVFFKDRLLDLKLLFRDFFPQYPLRFLEMINPIFSAFHNDKVKELVAEVVRSYYWTVQGPSDSAVLYRLMDQYTIFIPGEILKSIHSRIEQLQPVHAEIHSISFEPAQALPPETDLQLLSRFRRIPMPEQAMAVDLAWNYLDRDPRIAPQLLRLFGEEWSYDRWSPNENYQSQRLVVDSLWRRTAGGESPLHTKLFGALALFYLKTEFDRVEPRDKNTVTFVNFVLHPSEALLALRKDYWERLFLLSDRVEFGDMAYHILLEYTHFSFRNPVPTILKFDGDICMAQIALQAPRLSTRSRFSATRYLDFLSTQGLEVRNGLREVLYTKEEGLYRLLCRDRGDLYGIDLDHKELLDQITAKIQKRYSAAEFTEFEALVVGTSSLLSIVEDQYVQGQIVEGFTIALSTLEHRTPEFVSEVITFFLLTENPIRLRWVPIIALLKTLGSESTYALLTKYYFEDQAYWLLCYFQTLTVDDCNENNLSRLYDLFRTGAFQRVNWGFAFLRRYEPIDLQVVAKATRTLLDRSETAGSSFLITSLFYPPTDTHWDFRLLFEKDVEALERAFLIATEHESHLDFDATIFSQIIDLDSTFLVRFVDSFYQTNVADRFRRTHDSRDYSKLWLRSDVQDVVRTVWDRIFFHARKVGYVNTELLSSFFQTPSGDAPNPEIRDIQLEFLESGIDRYPEDAFVLIWIFELGQKFPWEQQISLFRRLISWRPTISLLERIELVNFGGSWSGSSVPMIQAKVDYLTSLLPFLSGLENLEYRIHVQRLVEGQKHKIAREKRHDFMSD